MGTPLAASMIRRATSFACDSMGTWLDATVIVFAPIVFANCWSPAFEGRPWMTFKPKENES